MVFVLLFLPVVLLSLIFLYKAGRITSEKMELQNAADAAAYSVSGAISAPLGQATVPPSRKKRRK